MLHNVALHSKILSPPHFGAQAVPTEGENSPDTAPAKFDFGFGQRIERGKKKKPAVSQTSSVIE
jgi:hypothetical protein